MYKVTTPTYKFVLPINTSDISKVLITFTQGCVTLNKTEEDVSMQDKEIYCQLTQQETKSFNDGSCYVQIRIKRTNDVVMSSRKFEIEVKDVFNEEIL